MSFKLVDKVKKSCLPGQLKAVLEAYLSFGNKDGTSIRPTAAKVAKRAGKSQRTVERYAPVLVNLGLLVHDRDEQGNYLVHNYAKPGVWAYVYHADLSSLDNPQVIAGFEFDKAILSEKRRAAAKSRSPRQLALFDSCKMAGTATDNLSETVSANLSETPTDKLSDRPDPKATLRSADHTKEDPSAVSTAVSKKESKQVSPSLAPLASAPSSSPVASLKQQNQNQLSLEAKTEEQNQPQTLQELVDSDQFFTEPTELL